MPFFLFVYLLWVLCFVFFLQVSMKIFLLFSMHFGTTLKRKHLASKSSFLQFKGVLFMGRRQLILWWRCMDALVNNVFVKLCVLVFEVFISQRQRWCGKYVLGRRIKMPKGIERCTWFLEVSVMFLM